MRKKYDDALRAYKDTDTRVKRLEKAKGGDWIYFNRKLRDEWEKAKADLKLSAQMLQKEGVRAQLPPELK